LKYGAILYNHKPVCKRKVGEQHSF